VSRDGKRLLAAIGGSSALASWSLTGGDARALAQADAQSSDYTFGSFDPTAARVAVTRGGRLSILDADTGQVLQQGPGPLAAALDYPVWSPLDGRSIVVVLTSAMPAPEPDKDKAKGKDKAAAMGGTLVRIPVALDGALGDPVTLVSAMPDETLRAPSYSPDGAWLAFERRKGQAQNPRDGALWLIAANGGAPIWLAALTAGAGPTGGDSSAAFLPAALPGRAFLLFASERSVGTFEPAEGQRQLFAAALNLDQAAAGADPSSAAFWLPFQQRTSSYLRVQWAPALAACTRTQEVCDGSDDDCDGRIDEDCCTPKPENCGDGADDDCDGRSDEGCGCGFRELCGNAVDDDCDLRVDEQPCAPH
jgi:hypothetical protein